MDKNIMYTINLYDGNFTFCRSISPFNYPKNFRWIKEQAIWEGLTVFTDTNIPLIDNIKSTKKIVWLIEPKEIFQAYNNIDIYENVFSKTSDDIKIITYDAEKLSMYPNKTIKSIHGSCWISTFCKYKLGNPLPNRYITNKIFNISMISSTKVA